MDTTRSMPRSMPSAPSRSEATPQALPLPFDDGADEVVPFVLTAAAHREGLGREVPPLAAVGPPAEPDEQSDTRRMQARALLRSGMPLTTIAAAMGAEVGDVERWTADLGDELARRRRRTLAQPARRAGRPAGEVESSGPRALLLPGLALALTEVDDDIVTIVHDRVEPVAVLLDALRADAEVAADRIRVAVRLAPDRPADRVRAEVAARLAVDGATITVGRSMGASARGVELRVDVRSARAASVALAWRDGRVAAEDVSGLRGWDSNPQTFRLTADCSAS